MNNQKDNKKTSIKTYGQDKSFNNISIPNKVSFDFVSKKTEKLLTALYMVTDCMDSDDALRSRLRILGVELFSSVYKMSISSPQEKETLLEKSINTSHEIVSFARIASSIGFISEMNMGILQREFLKLINDLDSHKDKNSTFSFALNADFFKEEIVEKELQKDNIKYKGHIKDNTSYKNNPIIKTDYYGHVSSSIDTNQVKQDRYNRILELIKDKREVNIKDISMAFTDCSEKTIQRTLNVLVSESKVKKTGSKRWSRYTYLASNLAS